MKKEEREFREEIRKQIEKEAQAKIDKEHARQKAVVSDGGVKKTAKLSHAVKEFIYIKEGWKFYRKHDDVLICANHLGEISFLTPSQADSQNEYYEHGKEGEKMVQKYLRKKPKFSLEDPNAEEYKIEVISDFNQAYDKWLIIRKKQLDQLVKMEESNKREKIIADEREKYYRNHPEYHIYQNHLDESKWMTEDEFRLQNEFFPPDETILDLIKSNPAPWFLGSSVFAIVIFFLTLYFWPDNNQYAYLQINSNEPVYRLLANRANYLIEDSYKFLRIPVKDTLEVNIRPFKPGYKVVSGNKKFLLVKGDTTRYIVLFRKIKKTENLAAILISANISEGKIFVNRTYYGDFPTSDTLRFEPGIYEIQLFKDGYRNISGTQIVDLKSKDDLVEIDFKFEPISSILASRAKIINGSISIFSNIQNADIYINNQLRGQTNKIIDGLQSGKYNIRVEKQGYKVLPKNMIIKLGPGREVATADFILTSKSGQLIIKIDPPHGSVYLDGNPFTTGSFDGLIPVGTHRLDPQPINGFRTPKTTEFEMKRDDYKKFNITYSPDIEFLIRMNNSGNIAVNGDITLISGYERLGVFKEDSKAGPEIVLNEQIGYAWKLGFGLRYDTPPGNDGFILVFNIPGNFDLDFPVYFEWEGYKTDENYPFTPAENHSIKVIVDGRTALNNYEPKYSLGDGNPKIERIKINHMLRPGNNRIHFSVTEENSAYYLVKGFRIH